MDLDPFAIELHFKWFIKKLKEDKQLDKLVQEYIEVVLKHRIYHTPSKGPKGEDGKDIVAIENEENFDYCSYIIKRGTLSKNLEGKFGILISMEKAIEIDLKGLNNKKRTLVVVYNDYDGSRGALEKFENKKNDLEQKYHNLVYRGFERWDLEILVKKLFPHRKEILSYEQTKREFDRLYEKEIAIDEFVEFAKNNEAKIPNLAKDLIERHTNIRMKYGQKE